MVYEFSGSECEGYTTNFRFVTRIDTGEQIRVTDQQSTTFEDLAAGKFRFETKSFTDDQLDKDVSGAAADENGKVDDRADGAGDKRALELADSRFPTEHMLEVIANARKGKALFEARIFDGSEDGDKTLPDHHGGRPGRASRPSPRQPTSPPVSWQARPTGRCRSPISTRRPRATCCRSTRMSFKLYENGISRDLTLDYGDFILTGKLDQARSAGHRRLPLRPSRGAGQSHFLAEKP